VLQGCEGEAQVLCWEFGVWWPGSAGHRPSPDRTRLHQAKEPSSPKPHVPPISVTRASTRSRPRPFSDSGRTHPGARGRSTASCRGPQGGVHPAPSSSTADGSTRGGRAAPRWCTAPTPRSGRRRPGPPTFGSGTGSTPASPAGQSRHSTVRSGQPCRTPAKRQRQRQRQRQAEPPRAGTTAPLTSWSIRHLWRAWRNSLVHDCARPGTLSEGWYERGNRARTAPPPRRPRVSRRNRRMFPGTSLTFLGTAEYGLRGAT
jgi:hypothetical protein